MKNEASSPLLSQSDNQHPVDNDSGNVAPVSNKSAGHTPSPVGKSSAPWQAGHGTGVSTNNGQKPSRTSPNLG